MDSQLSFTDNHLRTSTIDSNEGSLHLRDSRNPNLQHHHHQLQTIGPIISNELHGDDHVPPKDNETDPHVILKAFGEEERQVILALPGAQVLQDLRLFARLAPYFSGRYHIEEILFFANVRRSELLVILDLFQPVLALHEHEDTAITIFYDTSLRKSIVH